VEIRKVQLNIRGMTCDHCATSVAKILDSDGIVEKKVSFQGGSAEVSYDADIVSSEKITALINDGLPVGGTCVNVGCVPSKNLIRAAETLHRSKNNPFPGIKTEGSISDFRALIDQKRALVQTLREEKYVNIVKDMESFRLVKGRARVDAGLIQGTPNAHSTLVHNVGVNHGSFHRFMAQ